MGITTTLGSRFPRAENDLRAKITQAVGQVVKPTPVVPVSLLCSPVINGYRVKVDSRLLPGKSFEVILTESNLVNLDEKWQDFCNKITDAFIKELSKT